MSNGAVPAVVRPPMTFDESINFLTQHAKERGLDDWRVKVFRRSGPAAPMESVAVLDGARVDHFANAETWLVPLCGGGPHYVLSAYHNADPNTLVTAVIPPVINVPARPVDPQVVGREGWQGPAKLVFALNTVAPREPQPVPAQPGAVPPISSVFYNLPGAGGASESAPRTPPVALPAPGLSTESVLLAQMAQERQALVERRHTLEMEAAKRAADEQARRLEARISDLAEKMALPREPQKSLMDQVAPLVTAVVPVITQLMARAEADRRFMLEMEAKREEREARAREEAARREEKMLERISAQTAESAKATAANTEALGMMARTMVQTIASTQELIANAQPAPQDEGLMGIVKAGLAAFAEYTAASRLNQIATAPVPALGSAPRAAPRPQPPPPTQPGTALGTPPAPEAAGEPGEGEDAGEDGSGVPIHEADPNDVFHAIETDLRNHVPPEEVASFFLDALVNDGVRAAIQGGGGTINFFQARLGQAWIDVPENFEYMKRVLMALDAAAKARGVTQ